MLRLFSFFILAGTLVVIGFNCGGYRVLEGSAEHTSGGSQCIAKSLAAAAEKGDPFALGKVHYQGHVALKSKLVSLTAVDEETIPAETVLVAVVNHECELKNQKFLSHRFKGRGVVSHLFKIARPFKLQELENLAGEDQCLLGISNNLKVRPVAVTNDPLYGQQTHLAAQKVSQGHDFFFNKTTGITKPVIVAIIDTGVDINHEDLKENLWRNTKEIAGNNIDDDGNGYADDLNGYNFVSMKGNPSPEPWAGEWAGEESHGTHVAGLAAARGGNSKGGTGVIGQQVQIMSLNVFGPEPSADTTAIDNAIRYAADNGADVINMSLAGCGPAASMSSSIAYAVSKNVAVIVAASNENRELSANEADAANCDKQTGKVFVAPASYMPRHAGMLVMGSFDAGNFKKSSFSNYGNAIVEISAAGSDARYTGGILSTVPGNKYERFSGTSMASPMVSGAAALFRGFLKAHNISHSNVDLKNYLLDGSRAESALQNNFNGRALDLQALAAKAQEIPLPTATPTPTGTPVPTATPKCP